jgi:hypothetical protein
MKVLGPRVIRSVLLAFSLLVFADAGVAHPGPVDGNGCHLDGNGRRHCH